MAGYQTIYDASDYLPYTFNYKLLLFFVIPVVLLIILIFCRKTLQKSVIVLFISLSVFFAFFGLSLVLNFSRAKGILNDYINGNYSVVEGIIEQYNEDDYCDYFVVSDIEFRVPAIYSFSYPLRKIDGSLLDNGKYVRIYYVNSSDIIIIFRVDLSNEDLQ